jgi:hypothetical protein
VCVWSSPSKFSVGWPACMTAVQLCMRLGTVCIACMSTTQSITRGPCQICPGEASDVVEVWAPSQSDRSAATPCSVTLGRLE